MKDDIDAIIKELTDYKNELIRMDNKVRLYISDRKKHPHPNHEDLILKIRRYENRIHAIRNTEVQLRLDSLMYSLMLYERDWKKQFEDSPKKISVSKAAFQSAVEPSQKKASNHPLIEQLYGVSEKMWTDLSIKPTESKKELENRIVPQFRQAVNSLKNGEKVSFYYDKKTHRVQIRIKPKTL